MRTADALFVIWLSSAAAQVCGGENQPGVYGIVPPLKFFKLTNYSLTCVDDQPGLAYENTDYVDGNGPRGAHNASECCALCVAASGCNFWSFNVDPTLPATPGKCRWAALNYCCTFHSSGANLTSLTPSDVSNQYGIKGHWQSGKVKPTVAAGVGPSKTELELSRDKTRIWAKSVALQPLAHVLSEDIFDISGVQLNVSSTPSPNDGDVTISFEPSSEPSAERSSSSITSFEADESYTLSVSGTAVAITCKSYTGCAWGVVSLLQLLCVSGVNFQTVALPAVVIRDWPDVPYRGMLLDTARSLVTVQDIQDAIVFARHYKIRFLHLHLTDDHSWTFPSTAYPALGSANVGFRGRPPPVYKRSDLAALVAFADARGVTLVPEIEGPGHSSAMRRADPGVFGAPTSPQGGGVLAVTNETLYKAMATIVGEMVEVFKSSPFVHVGCDETGTPTSLPGYKAFAAAHNISNSSDLFAYYVKVVRPKKRISIQNSSVICLFVYYDKYMADVVKATGRTATVWGPASLARLRPDDAIVMVWNGGKGGAEDALKRNLSVINCPNEGGSLAQEFGHDIYDFSPPTSAGGAGSTIATNSRMLGNQVNMWEVGWGYAQAERWGNGVYANGTATSYMQQQVARASAAWWAHTWPRNNATVDTPTGQFGSLAAFLRAYASVDRERYRLKQPFAAAPSGRVVKPAGAQRRKLVSDLTTPPEVLLGEGQ